MIASASAVLQLRTQFLRVLSRPIKTLKKPFESLQSAAEPRQGAYSGKCEGNVKDAVQNFLQKTKLGRGGTDKKS
jgi:hypothetical protein